VQELFTTVLKAVRELFTTVLGCYDKSNLEEGRLMRRIISKLDSIESSKEGFIYEACKRVAGFR
jgi:hypothetical protein